MSLPTLILPPRFTEDTNLLRKAAIERGWEVERLSDWRFPADLRERELVLYGEPLFAAVIADQIDLVLLEPTFSWLTELSEYWLKRQVRFMTLEKAREEETDVFIKPADDKCFLAKVYSSGKFLPKMDVLPENTPVLVSEPVHWTLEFRCFLKEREVVTLSPYLRNGKLSHSENENWYATKEEQERALEFIQHFLADNEVQIPPAVVVDIGNILDRGWAIIEANAAWGSGIYGCDPLAILGVLQRACLNSEQITPADEPWIVHRK